MVEKPQIIVVAPSDYAPASFQTPRGQAPVEELSEEFRTITLPDGSTLRGLDVELISRFAERHGYDLDWKTLPIGQVWGGEAQPSVLEDLTRLGVDKAIALEAPSVLIGGWSYRPERTAAANALPPVHESAISLVVLASARQAIEPLLERAKSGPLPPAERIRVAALDGSALRTRAEANLSNAIELVPFEDRARSVQAVFDGEVDGVAEALEFGAVKSGLRSGALAAVGDHLALPGDIGGVWYAGRGYNAAKIGMRAALEHFIASERDLIQSLVDDLARNNGVSLQVPSNPSLNIPPAQR